MTPLESKISKDIETIINSTDNFLERYNSEQHTISVELHADLLYFQKRGLRVLTQFDRKDGIATIKGFGFCHIASGMGLHKSSIEPFPEDLQIVLNHLRVLKREIENGDLIAYSEMSKRELFGNHLEYGKYLLDEKHKDAAAVVIGSVLEDKLRMICEKNNFPIKAQSGKLLTIDPMNVNLAKNDIYSEAVKKEVELNGNIRKNAAHGHYDEYTQEQVEKMLDYVSTFNY
jgi:hypothetical protein